MSRFTLSVTYTVFNNKLSRYVRPILPSDACLPKCLFECFQVYPPPFAFLLTLFNVLDRFYRERQARSLARSHRVPFLLSPYCLHLVPVSITLAPVRLTGRDDDAAASALSRVALLSVACAELLRRAKHLWPTTRTPTDPPSFAREIPPDLLAARSDRSRSLRRNSRARLEKALPRSVHSRDRSIPRSTSPTFPPLNVHTGFETIRDVSPFSFRDRFVKRNRRRRERGDPE